MTILQLMQACESLKRNEIRNVDQESADLVVENLNLEDWRTKLDELLGEPLKTTQENPNFKAKALAKPFGGIQKNQTLYAKEFDEHCLIAMFWPWQNNRFTTIKIFHLSVIEYTKLLKPGLFTRLF